MMQVELLTSPFLAAKYDGLELRLSEGLYPEEVLVAAGRWLDLGIAGAGQYC